MTIGIGGDDNQLFISALVACTATDALDVVNIAMPCRRRLCCPSRDARRRPVERLVSARLDGHGYPRRVLHHLTLWVPDLRRAEVSWGWLLGKLGYTQDRSLGPVLLFRHASGFAVALEQSSDMVPGMLYSRMRPGLNHVAFALDSLAALAGVVGEAEGYGWVALPIDGHPIAGGAHVAYLEDGDGFEVELVAPSAS